MSGTLMAEILIIYLQEGNMYKKDSNEEISLLSRQDKRDIMFHVYMGCFIAVILAIVANSLMIIDSRKDEAADMEKLMNTVYSYMATATDQEFDNMTEKIRNDLVLSTYNKDQWQYAKMIPNTSQECRLEQDIGGHVFIVTVNTGNLYSLNLKHESIIDSEGSGTTIDSGYDEISGGSLSVYKDSDRDSAKVSVSSNRRIISVQQMKKSICDKCIEQILDVNSSSMYPEFVIFDKQEYKFYPVERDAEYKLEEYRLDMGYSSSGSLEIDVSLSNS